MIQVHRCRSAPSQPSDFCDPSPAVLRGFYMPTVWMVSNTGLHPPPQRPGQGAAGHRVSPCVGRGGWSRAGGVLAPELVPVSC